MHLMNKELNMARKLTKQELTGISVLVSKNRDSASLQKDTGLSYLDSINLKESIEHLIWELEDENLEEKLVRKFDISFDCDSELLVIKNNETGEEHRIDSDLLHSGDIAAFNIVNRKEEVSNLTRLTSENKNSGDLLMQEDLETLLESDEEFVFANYGTNGYITKADGAEAFNSVCEEVIESFVEFHEAQPNSDMGL